MNILKVLSQSAMISSIRGAQGGYRLAMEARDISLHMVIRAIEGPVHLVRCAQRDERDPSSGCERQSWCPVSATAQNLSRRLRQFLEGVTLADIVDAEPAAQPASVES